MGAERPGSERRVSLTSLLKGGGVRRRLPAGVADAALASLATFVTGLVAVNLLGDVDRGVYTVFFTAFGLGTVLPNQVTYGPTEILAIDRATGERLLFLRRSVALGSAMSAVASVSVFAAVLVTASVADTDLLVALAVTCGLTIFLSPTQDHVRRMLHIDGASWAAAAVSAVQLVTAALAIGALYVLDVPVGWVPFGALAIANLCSLTVGLIIAERRKPPGRESIRIRFAELWDLGWWLFVGSIVPSIAAFGVASIVTVLAGPEATGYTEAARIVGQPIIVLGTGLTAVLAPRIMETAIARELRKSNRIIVGYVGVIVVAAVAYLAVAGFDWALNPMVRIVPSAYVIDGLVAATIGAHVLLAILFLLGHELAAARRQRALAFTSMAVGPVRLLAASTAGFTGAFARPMAQSLAVFATLAFYQPIRSRYYAGGVAAKTHPVPEQRSRGDEL